MASMEEDFPRGGPSKKTTESRIESMWTEVDNLFQTSKAAETKKKRAAPKDDRKKVKKQKTDVEHGLTLNADATNVEILHSKNVIEGTLLLGCVTEVTDFEAVVGLPCGLQGFLSIKNICDSFTKMLGEQLDSDDVEDICSLQSLFRPGMLIRCAVAKLRVSTRGPVSIQLSVNPKLVNKGLTSGSLKAGMVLSGCVESVEDHGCIVDIGVSGSKAFLPKTAGKDQRGDSDELAVGQYLTALVMEVKNNGRVVRLAPCGWTGEPSLAEPKQGWTLSSLLPGLLVRAKIRKVTKHGLFLDFLHSFKGQVDFLHMEPERHGNYSQGEEVRARLLYIEPSTHTVGLSLLGHLLQPGAAISPAPAGGSRVGEVARECAVTSVHHLSGAMLELPDKAVAFVHKNHLNESNQPANENKVLPKSVHDCRILEFSPMEQIHFASLRKSVISRPFFTYKDLHAGQVVEGTVSELLDHGMVVNLTPHIRGLVPSKHLSDTILKNPEKRYREGMKVKCRVLSVDPLSRKLYLSRKESLVKSTLPLFISYSDARPGRISHGNIVCIKDFGCIVRFYNNVKGLVPTRELSSEPVLNPEELFYVGQVLKAKVLHCDAEQAKMILSFKAALEGDATEPDKPQVACEVGQLCDVQVLKKSERGLEVEILPAKTRALVPTMHLSDHTSNCALLLEALQEGDTISNLACVTKNKQNITLTKKPAVKSALEDGVIAEDFSQITVGMQLVGWIKNIMTYGVFVEFPYGLVGLAPKMAMTDSFLKDTADAFQMGQTVFAKVTNLDEEKKRFLVTLKTSEVGSPEGDMEARLVSGLQERRAAVEVLAKRAYPSDDLSEQLAALTVGEKLKLTVEEASGSGATFKSDDIAGAAIRAHEHHLKGVSLQSGQKVTAVVLHVDILSSSMVVSPCPALVEKKKSLVKGASYAATVQHVDRDFAAVSMDDKAQLTVIQWARHPNDAVASAPLAPGASLSVTVLEPGSPELRGLPLVSWRRAAPKRQRAAPGGNRTAPSGHRIGDILRGKAGRVKPSQIQVTLEDGSRGVVHVSEVLEPTALCPGSFPTSQVRPGDELTVRVIGGHHICANRFLPLSHPKYSYIIPELTLVPSKLNPSQEVKPVSAEEKLSGYAVGDQVMCFVSKYVPQRKFLEVTLDPCLTGTVELLAMTTERKDLKHPEKLHKLGKTIVAEVVEVNSKPPRLVLSLTGFHKLEKGMVCLGMVHDVLPQLGLQVRLPFGGKGTAAVTDLADEYKPNPLEPFSKGQLLSFYLLGNENEKWQLSLRPSRLNPKKAQPVRDPEIPSSKSLEEGQIIRGYVSSVAAQGVFIRLSTSITGRARLHQSTKYAVKNHAVLGEHLPPNRLITAKIISIDDERSLVELSLLAADTGLLDILPKSVNLPLRPVSERKAGRDAVKRKPRSDRQEAAPVKLPDLDAPKKKKKKGSVQAEEADSGVEAYFREDDDQVEDGGKPPAPASQGPSRLQVAAGFSWDVGLSTLKPASAAKETRSSDDEEPEEGSKKKTRHELEQEKKAGEKALQHRELELMDPGLRPQDATAFERLLLASPDSSLLWLQYMAHHLQATQIEQARAVAERALKTISFREEREKLNVWVALLNLENMYGSEESLSKVFQRALQFCEPMPVYQQLADIYAKSDKIKQADSMYKTMVKRFRDNKAVWLSYGTFLLQRGEGDAADALMQRALRSLPPRESVDVIAKFAQLEFRHGSAEKGRAMFDKVLTNYPNRTDLWSVFIDLVIKHGTQEDVRALLERAIHLSVSAKKIKFFFKRYLEYEKAHGTPQSVRAVKQKAVEFVEARGAEAAD